jgi:hypothetical protein
MPWSAFFFDSKGDGSCRGFFADLTKNHYRDGIMAGASLEYMY